MDASPKKNEVVKQHDVQGARKTVAIHNIKELPAFDDFALPRRFTRDKRRKSTIKKSLLGQERTRGGSLIEMSSQIDVQRQIRPFKIDMVTHEGQEFPLPTYTRSYSFASNLEYNLSTMDDELVLLTEGMIKVQMERNRSTWMIVKSIFEYIIASWFKKKSTFNIGVMAVVLSTAFIVTVQSLLDVAPVAFLTVSQRNVGVFDFVLSSDYNSFFVSGDNDLSRGPFRFVPKEKPKSTNLLKEIERATYANNGDHLELLGLNLLKFDVFKEKLDPLTQSGPFKGFTPRWTLPTRLRNPTDPNKNSSCILVILDSSREVDLEIAKYFTKDVMWKSELMAHEQLLSYLDVPTTKKGEVEMYFDLVDLVKLLATQSK